MSISQHIAGIRTRVAQSRANIEDHDRVPTQDRKSELEQSSNDHGHDISRKMSQTGISDSATTKISQPPSFSTLRDVDIAQDFDVRLQQINALEALEQRWCDISTSIDATLSHLQECGEQVAGSSKACLNSLKDTVDYTCDKVDNELKSFYHLMTKCDELNTKLSIASSFRQEMETLRKSVETLEQLMKR